MAYTTINWCEWEQLVNEKFIPLINCKDRYVIMYGGRGSSKSNFEAKKLIYRCLSEPYFRHILIRNTYATIKDSSYQTIRDIIFDLGLENMFVFKVQPLEIHCINGNSFLARGCDDTQKLKSIKDPTGAWYEEDIPSEADFITITTSIRTEKATYLQETFTINPEVEGNFNDHWFYKRFFGERTELDFSNTTSLQINEFTSVDLTYTVHHSNYTHNKWLPDSFRGFLLDLKTRNPYYYTIYCLGNWGNKQLGGRFYKNFDLGKNVFNYKYRPELPLHISFDFNVNPYMSCSVWQIEGKGIYLIDEIAMADPKNKVKDTCWEFIRRYNNHIGGLFIYGDPSGKQEDVSREKGFNHFTIIGIELEKYHPTFRIARAHPPVKTRGDFINTIFEQGFDGINIYLYERSVYLKNDLLYGKEDSDGTKHKEKARSENGVSYEKYHHFSDGMDYFICEAFADSFYKYQKGDIKLMHRLGGNKQITQVRL